MVTGMGKDKDKEKDIWEPLDAEDGANQATWKGALRTMFWVWLALLSMGFLAWVLANTVMRPHTAESRTLTLSPVVMQHDTVEERFAVPCWSRSRNPHPTCTPTAVPVATDTPTGTPTAVPTDTAIPATPPPTPSPTPTATPVVEPWRNPPQIVLDQEAELERLINEHRASIGLRTLRHMDVLSTAQRWWAYDMVSTNQCYHGDFGNRAYSLGYTGFAWGEAGACGYPDAAAALQGWLNSPGHRGIVEGVEAFGCTFDEMGVGAWQYPNGYWQHWLLVGASTCTAKGVPK